MRMLILTKHKQQVKEEHEYSREVAEAGESYKQGRITLADLIAVIVGGDKGEIVS